MGGWTTNGVQVVAPITVNGVLQQPPAPNFNLTTNTVIGTPQPLTLLPSTALISADIQSGNGQQPTTAAATAFQIAAMAAALITNTATSTVHTATINTTEGLVTTEALTTAPGALYTFTLTNSLLVAGAPAPQVVVRNGTNTGGAFQVNSVTNATGSTVIVVQNVGPTALNGTVLIAFHA